MKYNKLSCIGTCILLILLSFPAPCQLERGQQRVGTDGKTYSERDRERTADNTAKGNTTLQPWVMDKQAIDQLVEQWRRNSPNYRKPQSREELAEIDRKWNEQDQQKREIIMQQKHREWPVRSLFISAGFGGGEQYSDLVEDITNTGDSMKLNFALGMIAAKKSFELSSKTATFDFLSGQILQYTPMFETAVEDLAILEQRFPENTSRIDTLRLIGLSYAFGNTYPGYAQVKNSRYGDHYAPQDDENDYFGGVSKSTTLMRRKNLSLFETLSGKYPQFAQRIAATASVVDINNYSKKNPFVLLARKYSGRKKPEEKNMDLYKKNCLLAMHTPYPPEDAQITSLRLSGMYDYPWPKEFTQLIKSISKQEWAEIAKAQGLASVKDIALLFTGECLYKPQQELKKLCTEIASKM